MATYEQVMEALRRADAAGNHEDAQRLAQMASSLRPAEQAPQQLQPSDYDKSYIAQGTSGLNEGIANTLGAPVDLLNTGMELGARGVNALTGSNLHMSPEPFLGSAHIKELMGAAIRPPVEGEGRQFLRRAAQSVGGAIVPATGAAAGAAQPVKTLALALASGLGGGIGGATAQQVAPGNRWAEMAGETVGSLAPVGVSAVANALKTPKMNAPTLDELQAKAGALYDAAEQSGVRIPQTDTQNIAGEMKGIAAQEGLVSPTGRVSTAYPKLSDALTTFDDYAQGDMTIPQVQAARKTLSNIAKSTDPAEARIGSMMLDKFDDLIAPSSPELMQANEVYRSFKKGSMIEQAIDLAGARAGQFSGSGFENALRTEFRQLDRKIIKGQIKGLSDEEIQAIQRVARGGPVENTLRYVGKLAPTGPVSFATSGGLPFMIGNAIGGPPVGAAASGATMGVGFLGREAATQMASRNAEIAAALARGGTPGAVAPILSEAQKRALLAALAGQSAQDLSNGVNQ